MPRNEQDKQNQAALRGANRLIDHLAHTGTGADKLDVAREALNDLGEADGEEGGARAVLTHLKRRGVTEGTLEKAEKFVDGGMKDDAAARRSPGDATFHPGATAPGSVAPPQGPAQRGEPTRHDPKGPDSGNTGTRK